MSHIYTIKFDASPISIDWPQDNGTVSNVTDPKEIMRRIEVDTPLAIGSMFCIETEKDHFFFQVKHMADDIISVVSDDTIYEAALKTKARLLK